MRRVVGSNCVKPRSVNIDLRYKAYLQAADALTNSVSVLDMALAF
jgi:hypothetical protein